jgi:hypothetical protein
MKNWKHPVRSDLKGSLKQKPVLYFISSRIFGPDKPLMHALLCPIVAKLYTNYNRKILVLHYTRTFF